MEEMVVQDLAAIRDMDLMIPVGLMVEDQTEEAAMVVVVETKRYRTIKAVAKAEERSLCLCPLLLCRISPTIMPPPIFRARKTESQRATGKFG
jgi:hypothetical protein